MLVTATERVTLRWMGTATAEELERVRIQWHANGVADVALTRGDTK